MKFDVWYQTTIQRCIVVSVPDGIEDPKLAAIAAVTDRRFTDPTFYPDLRDAHWEYADTDDNYGAYEVSDAYVPAMSVLRWVNTDDPASDPDEEGEVVATILT